MNEASKTKLLWGDFERSILQGRGIDIGCGPDLVSPNARGFDLGDGDANDIARHVHEQFDFVYSSHCLEHMHDPRRALAGWWSLVRPGGHLFCIVPEEDLYEQGIFPSRFNSDHKATFTLAKARSWSPVSHNVLDLIRELPDGRLVSAVVQDHGYDRSVMRFGKPTPRRGGRFLPEKYAALVGRLGRRLLWLERLIVSYCPLDQTRLPGVVAQIQFIVRKEA